MEHLKDRTTRSMGFPDPSRERRAKPMLVARNQIWLWLQLKRRSRIWISMAKVETMIGQRRADEILDQISRSKRLKKVLSQGLSKRMGRGMRPYFLLQFEIKSHGLLLTVPKTKIEERRKRKAKKEKRSETRARPQDHTARMSGSQCRIHPM